jgi:hypothetical protein
MMRRVVIVLAPVAMLFASAAFYSRGPIIPDHVVYIQVPELVDEAANQVGAKVTDVRKAEPGSVPLQFSLEAKRILKVVSAAIGAGLTEGEYAETYTVMQTGTNLSLKCTFRARGDQVIGIALEQIGNAESFFARFKPAFQQRFPGYAVSILPPNKSLERTRGE